MGPPFSRSSLHRTEDRPFPRHLPIRAQLERALSGRILGTCAYLSMFTSLNDVCPRKHIACFLSLKDGTRGEARFAWLVA